MDLQSERSVHRKALARLARDNTTLTEQVLSIDALGAYCLNSQNEGLKLDLCFSCIAPSLLHRKLHTVIHVNPMPSGKSILSAYKECGLLR